MGAGEGCIPRLVRGEWVGRLLKGKKAKLNHGRLLEWLMRGVCKTSGYAYGSSNLSSPISRHNSEVEYLIGNEEAVSSNLTGGSRKSGRVA